MACQQIDKLPQKKFHERSLNKVGSDGSGIDESAIAFGDSAQNHNFGIKAKKIRQYERKLEYRF